METNIYHLKKREYQQIPKIIAEQKQRPLDDWSRSWPVQWWTCSQVIEAMSLELSLLFNFQVFTNAMGEV